VCGTSSATLLLPTQSVCCVDRLNPPSLPVLRASLSSTGGSAQVIDDATWQGEHDDSVDGSWGPPTEDARQADTHRLDAGRPLAARGTGQGAVVDQIPLPCVAAYSSPSGPMLRSITVV